MPVEEPPLKVGCTSPESLLEQVATLTAELARTRTQWQNERAGRIRLQRQLRGAALGSGPAADALLGTPVATLHSCFSRRNGTPRQPGLVSAARASLRLRAGVPPDSLHGLADFSHVWVLYLFHANTDLHRGGDAALKSRVAVPRLDGETRGVFATRTPHRPLPIGLSLGRLLAVDAQRGTVLLEGLDCVDGTPVLDMKPFVPFCDAPQASRAPAWVAQAAPDGEPLAIASVFLPADVERQLWVAYGEAERSRAAREERPGPPLYASAGELAGLVRQALALDIRSLRQRTGPAERRLAVYHVILCCVEVDYTISDAREVSVLGGRAVPSEAEWEAAAAAADLQLDDYNSTET
jgi:tRNA-Thr(GGU) m(6)t(6)A37 methyltransferase TsaA